MANGPYMNNCSYFILCRFLGLLKKWSLASIYSSPTAVKWKLGDQLCEISLGS